MFHFYIPWKCQKINWLPLIKTQSKLEQKMKFSIKDISSKCDQIRTDLLEKSLMENFIFLCSETGTENEEIFYAKIFLCNHPYLCQIN